MESNRDTCASKVATRIRAGIVGSLYRYQLVTKRYVNDPPNIILQQRAREKYSFTNRLLDRVADQKRFSDPLWLDWLRCYIDSAAQSLRNLALPAPYQTAQYSQDRSLHNVECCRLESFC